MLKAMPEYLEQKSIHGWTPLHIAIAIKRPEIVELLLSAGANPRAVDMYNCNVVHNMLVPLHRNKSWNPRTMANNDPKPISAMISLFDKKDIKEMLLEKCTLGPELASLTPIAYWMANNDSNANVYAASKANNKTDILEILSSFSDGEDLGIINGGGDLPLHQVSAFWVVTSTHS